MILALQRRKQIYMDAAKDARLLSGDFVYRWVYGQRSERASLPCGKADSGIGPFERLYGRPVHCQIGYCVTDFSRCVAEGKFAGR